MKLAHGKMDEEPDIFDNTETDDEDIESDNDTDNDTEDDDDMETEDDDDDDDEDTIENKIDRLVDSKRDVFDAKVEEYVENGMKIETAENQAHEEMLENIRHEWLNSYTKLIKDIQGLKQNKIHRSVMDYVKKYKEEDYSLDEAIKKAVCKRQYAFDKYIKESLEDEEEEEEDSEEGDITD